MEYKIHSHRFALSILETEPEFTSLWNEVKQAITSIDDEMIIRRFEKSHFSQKSLSRTINELLKEEFIQLGWKKESRIFQNSKYSGDAWRLDFAKKLISIEVAFNHSSVIAWNLLKPVLAGELNHIEKAIQTELGIIICATDELKRAGGFDSAVGSYERYLNYLDPLRNQLSVPILLIGLEAPKTFKVTHEKANTKNKGKIVRI